MYRSSITNCVEKNSYNYIPIKWFSFLNISLIEFYFGIHPYLKLVRFTREVLILKLFETFPIKSPSDTLRDYRHVKNTSWPILTTAFWRARVKRCHGAVSAWMFHEAASLPHAGDHTRTCACSCLLGDNPGNAHLNHCHLTDWPVSMALVKKRKRKNLQLSVMSRSFRAWTNVCVYRGNGKSEEKRENFISFA